MTEVEFRDLSGITEFRAAEALQVSVWGAGDTPDPADLMMVIQAEGGLVGGAFAEGRLVGYIFGFPTGDHGIQHSHRLAVLPEMRGRGLGAELKWYQRRWCLERGIHHVRWTFDPLRSTNARLNLRQLGARSNTYYVDYYGEMGGINQGLPSDRLLVDWYLDDPCVKKRLAGYAEAPALGNLLRIPLSDGAQKSTNPSPPDDLECRINLRKALLDAFACGYELIDFVGNDYIFHKVPVAK